MINRWNFLHKKDIKQKLLFESGGEYRYMLCSELDDGWGNVRYSVEVLAPAGGSIPSLWWNNWDKRESQDHRDEDDLQSEGMILFFDQYLVSCHLLLDWIPQRGWVRSQGSIWCTTASLVKLPWLNLSQAKFFPSGIGWQALPKIAFVQQICVGVVRI